VMAGGVAYFSAAGNGGRKSYEAPFNDSGIVLCIEFYLPIGDCDPIYERVGRMHDFDPGPGVDVYQNITVPVDTVLNVALQWDQPFGGPGPNNDHDIVLLDETGGIYFTLSANDNVITGEGWEVVQFQNAEVLGYGDKFSLAITYDDVDSAGPPATLLKTVVFGSATIDDFPTHSSTLTGHANAAGAEAVGAAFFADTPEFGVSPPQPEPYSSAGGTPILFNSDGTPRSSAEVRAKPDISAVDGVNTTFFFSDSYGNDGVDDFFGTSAAAPHAAAVAALMLAAQAGTTPAQIRSAMQDSAIDMGAAGFDQDTGAGLVQADAAIAALQAGGGNNPPSASFDVSISGLQIDFADSSSDSDGSITAWAWNFGDGGTSGAQNPSHTYLSDGSFDVTLTVTDDDDATGSATRTVTVSAGGVNAAPVASFTWSCNGLDCSFDGSGSSDDAGIVAYAWNFGDGSGSSQVSPLHRYSSQGTYTVTLTVTDADAASDTATASFRVKNRGNGSGGGDGGGSGGKEKGAMKCSDGIDNDGDGLTDGADPDCQ
ncbi:MAG TPA: PKD domain-containing protein, partial [Woeseiaceae bacterium]|nr:PKD domain-containing protein [Woeseiaceae bacterium]